MITPAVLISACGTLILSTSSRLGRVVDRVRALSREFEALARGEPGVELLAERRALIFHQLERLTRRVGLLQRGMTLFYVALGVFVLTSLAIGIVSLAGGSTWTPVVLALFGASCLFYGSALLIFEARLAHATVRREMDFLRRMGEHYAPAELMAEVVETRRTSRPRFRRPGSRPR